MNKKTVKERLPQENLREGDIVRYYLNPKEYVLGEVIEICFDNTVWVRHRNGQQRNYPAAVLKKHHIGNG